MTPVDAQPLQVVQRALKMFEGEVQTAGIQMEFVLTDSFTRLGVDWVKIDPSRVLQVWSYGSDVSNNPLIKA